ncbi:hypothetical protein [Spirosoma fluminis]
MLTSCILALIAALVFEFIWKLLFDDEMPSLRLGIRVLIIVQVIDMTSCKPKPKAVPSTPTVIYADTTRVRLQHKADQSANELLIVRANADSTVTSFNHAETKFDSVHVTLP